MFQIIPSGLVGFFRQDVKACDRWAIGVIGGSFGSRLIKQIVGGPPLALVAACRQLIKKAGARLFKKSCPSGCYAAKIDGSVELPIFKMCCELQRGVPMSEMLAKAQGHLQRVLRRVEGAAKGPDAGPTR